MNSWIWIAPALLLPAMLLLGRYTVRIRFEKASGPLRFILSLRTAVSICGLDYDTASGGLRIVLLNRPFSMPFPRKRAGGEPKRDGDPSGRAGKRCGKRLPGIRAVKETLEASGHLLRRIRKTIRMRRLTVRFSAGDPAWTGMLAGLAGAVSAFADADTKTEWIPDFRSVSVSGSAEIEARFVMARFLSAGLGGAWRLASVIRRHR
ncbi:hypothetical protein JW777_09365 [bacterium]|nr:hypothetical protein [bacterium]